MPGSGSSESSGSIKLGRTIGGAGTLRDCAGTAEGDTFTLGDGGRLSGSNRFGQTLGGAVTLGDGAGNAEEDKITLQRWRRGNRENMQCQKRCLRRPYDGLVKDAGQVLIGAELGVSKFSKRGGRSGMQKIVGEGMVGDYSGIGGRCLGHRTGRRKNCTVLAMLSERVVGMYTR